MVSGEGGDSRLYYLGGEGFEDDVFSNIEVFSLGLYGLCPEYFVPFLF